MRGLGSCAPGVTLPLAGPLPALLRCQRRPPPALRAALSCACGLQRGRRRGWGCDGLGNGARGKGREGAEGIDVDCALDGAVEL